MLFYVTARRLLYVFFVFLVRFIRILAMLIKLVITMGGTLNIGRLYLNTLMFSLCLRNVVYLKVCRLLLQLIMVRRKLIRISGPILLPNCSLFEVRYRLGGSCVCRRRTLSWTNDSRTQSVGGVTARKIEFRRGLRTRLLWMDRPDWLVSELG